MPRPAPSANSTEGSYSHTGDTSSIVDRHFIETLGLQQEDPDWELIGRDWTKPRQADARERLYATLIRRWAVSANVKYFLQAARQRAGADAPGVRHMSSPTCAAQREASGITEEVSMADQPRTPHLEPTQEAGRLFFSRNVQGPVVMLNLMRFRSVADYSAAPEMAPASPISGEAAYKLYMDHTLPFLLRSGGEVLFYGKGGSYLIGPTDERWDAAMLVRQSSIASFLAFASDREYLLGLAHRTAALEDSRLLPLVQQ